MQGRRNGIGDWEAGEWFTRVVIGLGEPLTVLRLAKARRGRARGEWQRLTKILGSGRAERRESEAHAQR